MGKRYVIRKRQNGILYFETFLTAGFLSLVLWQAFKYHWIFSVIIFGICMCGFIYAFFEWRFFRYVITVLYSMAYGFLAYFCGRAIDKDTFTVAVVLAFLAYLLSIAAHKEHFDFLSNAKFLEYEKHS